MCTPLDINTSDIVEALTGDTDNLISFLANHWQDFLLQYIGILTFAIFGLLLAIVLPVIGN